MKNRFKEIAIGIILVTSVTMIWNLVIENAKLRNEDPERAQFMLDCSYDYKPETCQAILEGELPPSTPDNIPGC
jgi:hypothetical protein